VVVADGREPDGVPGTGAVEPPVPPLGEVAARSGPHTTGTGPRESAPLTAGPPAQSSAERRPVARVEMSASRTSDV
jgi:hypothetical protein